MTHPDLASKLRKLHALSAALVFAGIIGSATVTQAAPAYPERPVRIVVPYGPKSDTAGYTRLLVTAARKVIASSEFIEDHRVGDSGAIAASEVKLAPADGYTLLMGRVGSQVIAPALKPSLPYRWNDFTFIGVVEIDPLLCAVRSDSPYTSARELMHALRVAPGTLKYSHSGTGTIQNVSAQYLMRLAGAKFGSVEGVSFPGGPEAATALIAEQVNFLCSNAASLVQPIKDGKLRPLFTTAPGRMPGLPDVPNAREVGLRDLSTLNGWSVLVGPPGLPAPVIARWREALRQVAKDPGWVAAMTERGAMPAIGTTKDSERFIKEQAEFYERLAPLLRAQQ
ncbi:MAG: tripartite tricarboxylate transporter substrate binding protein [Rhodocyclaceae bacterium]|nr:tripartite tricarboxylate transporter substrate binding protein [Rhodocyclaceae bacterium]